MSWRPSSASYAFPSDSEATRRNLQLEAERRLPLRVARHLGVSQKEEGEKHFILPFTYAALDMRYGNIAQAEGMDTGLNNRVAFVLGA